MRQSILYIFIYLLTPFFISFCYTQTTFTGSVVDTSGAPIEFANVYIKGKPLGTNTDEHGNFILKLNDVQLNKDSLIISHIGYQNEILALKNIRSDEKFILKAANLYNLHSVLVLRNTEKEAAILGANEKKTDQFFRNNLYESYQIATLIVNELGREGFISEIQIYIGSLGSQSDPFRIKLFEVDSICNCPGKPLIPEDIIVKKIKKGWNTIMLSDFYPDIPKTGFFISYQWLYGDQKNVSKSIFESSHSIGITKDKKTVLTYEKIGDSPWSRLDFLNLQQFKLLFKAKVMYYINK